MNRYNFIDMTFNNIGKYDKVKDLQDYFGTTAALWSFYLGDICIDPYTVPLLLAFHSIALTDKVTNTEERDKLYADAMAYIALAGEVNPYSDTPNSKSMSKDKKKVLDLIQRIRDVNPAIYKDNNPE